MISISDDYRHTSYVVGSRHLNGANYIADFERQTSYCSLDPDTLSFPSHTSLYDSINVSPKNNRNMNNSRSVFAKSNFDITPQHHDKVISQDHSKRKSRSSNNYVQWLSNISRELKIFIDIINVIKPYWCVVISWNKTNRMETNSSTTR